MQVYLAGPMTGHMAGEISDWRAWVRERCQGIDFIDPALAFVDATDAFQVRENASQALQRLNHGRFVLDRSNLLIRNADVVLANFLGAGKRASIGSVGELFWAHAYGKPIVIVREQFGNVHDHAMLNATATRITYSLEEGCEALVDVLGLGIHVVSDREFLG